MNPMQNAWCEYRVVNPKTVVVTIDLSSHVHLRDEDLVNRCMRDYYMRFFPKVHGWEVEITGDKLEIVITGDLNLK